MPYTEEELRDNLHYQSLKERDEIKYEQKFQKDLSKFLTYNNSTHPLFDGFIDYMKKDNLTKDIEGHPSQKGHYFLFEKIQTYWDLKLIWVL